MFNEQVGWAVDADVDFVIGETFSWGEEAVLATETIKSASMPAVVTLAVQEHPETREGWSLPEAYVRLKEAGADVVGLTAAAGPDDASPDRGAALCRRGADCGASRPVPDNRGGAELPIAHQRAGRG